ncbi:MAG: hypothetical protein GDA56_06585 [Hormoscilla sp. GM7CHS1pb]|nr:hypothetical protein [Hormoscilla sp. GM7CHS1pb]
MGWQLPGDYVLHLNYYWDEWGQVSDRSRPLTVILLDCTRLTVQLNPTRPKSGYQSHLGTIVGWGLVTPSEWLRSFSNTACCMSVVSIILITAVPSKNSDRHFLNILSL